MKEHEVYNLLIPIMVLAGLAGIICFAVFAARGARRPSGADVRAFREASAPDSKKSKDQVRVVFHTYSGFLVCHVRRKYDFWADPQQAAEILWRLHKNNCTRGLFALGGPFIPFVSDANYLIQRRSIRRQLAAIPWEG